MKTVNLTELAEKLKNFSQYKDVKGLKKFSEKCVQIGNRLEAPLTIMVMGEFSTGKSTLINAIVGQEIAAVNATPTTAVITVLTYGETEKVVVHYKNGYENEFDAKNFAKLTAMSANSKFNNLHSTIKYVERFMPLDILKDVAVIDSPGLNDTDEGHIAATEKFMDNADVVLWVSSVEQAGKRSEIDSMKMLSSRLKPVLVVNKIDMVDEEEEDPKEILSRLENQLGNRVQSVIGVSAKMALQGKLNNDEAKLEASNFNELTFYIQMFVLPNRYQIKLNSFFDELGTLFSFELEHILNDLMPYYKAGLKVDETKYKPLLATLQNWQKDLENLVSMVNNDMEEFIKQGNASALFFKGMLFDIGLTVIESKNQAEQYLQQAQELNHLMAKIELGGVYHNVGKYDLVIETLQELADKENNTDAQELIGYAYNEKGERDLAEQYLQRAAKSDKVRFANAYLGFMYWCKENRTEEDAKKTVKYCESAIASEVFWALPFLGACYRDGVGVEQNYKKALELFLEAAEAGITNCYSNLAEMYYQGFGTDVDKDKALYWLKIAAELNDNDSIAYVWLGHLYLDEDEYDEDEAFKYYAKAADLGNAEAQNMLGRCYTEGWGCEKDANKAFEYFKQAADNANEDARNNLALCYLNGEGVVQNWNYGYSKLQQYAQQGNENAQNLIRQIDANNNSANEYEDNQDNDDNDHTISGAAIGAGIGTAVLGPLGTIIGGAIGGWLGNKGKK